MKKLSTLLMVLVIFVIVVFVWQGKMLAAYYQATYQMLVFSITTTKSNAGGDRCDDEVLRYNIAYDWVRYCFWQGDYKCLRNGLVELGYARDELSWCSAEF